MNKAGRSPTASRVDDRSTVSLHRRSASTVLKTLAAGGKLERVSRQVHRLVDGAGTYLGPVRPAVVAGLVRDRWIEELADQPGRYRLAAG